MIFSEDVSEMLDTSNIPEDQLAQAMHEYSVNRYREALKNQYKYVEKEMTALITICKYIDLTYVIDNLDKEPIINRIDDLLYRINKLKPELYSLRCLAFAAPRKRFECENS